MNEAYKKLDLMFMFARHSDVPEEGLAQGSLITHVEDGSFGDTSIFSDSKVLIYEFVRGQSILGVIINRKINNVRVGGPCGLRR